MSSRYGRRRDAWLKGRRAKVDGIEFEMPVANAPSPAMSAVYGIDAEAADKMLPGQELHPLAWRGRGALVVAVVDYKATSIGTYVEFCIGIACTKGRRRWPAPLAVLLARWSGLGVYIYDLPVSTEISVKGGCGIWGMAKRRANLDFVITDDMVSSQYSLDDQLVVRFDLPKPKSTRLPFRMSGAGYGAWRGLLTRSRIRMTGRAGVPWRARDRCSLILGDHPRAAPLHGLDISDCPLFCSYIPGAVGVLDDYIESWFLTGDPDPPEPDFGLDDVIGLGLSQQRLPDPDRSATDPLSRTSISTNAMGSA